MLKRLVPTSDTVLVTAPVFAFSTDTSASGSENPDGMAASQTLGVGNLSSTQWLPFHWTITPTAGAGGSDPLIGGFGGDGPPSAATALAPIAVERFPASSTET